MSNILYNNQLREGGRKHCNTHPFSERNSEYTSCRRHYYISCVSSQLLLVASSEVAGLLTYYLAGDLEPILVGVAASGDPAVGYACDRSDESSHEAVHPFEVHCRCQSLEHILSR